MLLLRVRILRAISVTRCRRARSRFVDDAKVPEHKITNKHLFVKWPARVSKFDVTEPIDCSLDVDGIPGISLDRLGRGRRVRALDDLEAPNSAAAVSLPLFPSPPGGGAVSSLLFLLPPNSDPKKPLSFSLDSLPPFLPPLSPPHLPNRPFLSLSRRLLSEGLGEGGG